MQTLLEVMPSAIKANVARNIAEIHKNCLVSFLMPRENHKGKFESIGTGFFIFSPDMSVALLMTARHVLEQFNLSLGKITIDEKLFEIGDVGIRRMDPNADLAQWEIPADELIAKGVLGIPTLPTFTASEATLLFHPLDSFILLGYPCSKNAKLDFRNGQKPDREIFALAMHGSEFNVANRIRQFRYAGKGQPESWRPEISTPPALDGMSGSPCLRIVLDRDKKNIAVVLAGVFFSWSRQSKRLSVASFADPWI